MSGLVLGIPPAIIDVVQQGLLERQFHDGLYPALQYRAEAIPEEWPANTGQEIVMTRPGLLAPAVKPLLPGQDPQPKTVTYEQWVAILDQYGDTMDTNMPTSTVANASLFLRNIHTQGLQAGQTVNRLARNALFCSYLSGNTLTTAAALAVDTTISVASVNGFTEVVIPGSNSRPRVVSPGTPLPITITGIGTRNVIGFTLDNPDDPKGPGTLELDAALGAGVAPRTPVLSSDKPFIIRSGGGESIDAIGAGDTFVLQDVINSCNYLRDHSVQPHEDGYFHAHINGSSNSQVFLDPAWQRLNQSRPDDDYYHHGFLGTISGIKFFLNTESPKRTNSGALTATGASALYGDEIGAEVVNEGGIEIGRVLVTGRGALREKWLKEDQFTTEAGTTGKIGEFQVVNAGITVLTERIRLIIRAPVDRLQQKVSHSWTISTSFPVPSDITATSGPERFKRAVVIEHAKG